MNYSTLFVGMDVHKETFTLCCYDMEDDKVFHTQKVESDYMLVLKYLNAVRSSVGQDVQFLCGYEAGTTPPFSQTNIGNFVIRKGRHKSSCDAVIRTGAKK